MSSGINSCPYVAFQDSMYQVDAFQNPPNSYTLMQRDLVQLDTFQQFGDCTAVKRRTSYMWDLTIGGHNRLVMREIKKKEKRKKEELTLLMALLGVEEGD